MSEPLGNKPLEWLVRFVEDGTVQEAILVAYDREQIQREADAEFDCVIEIKPRWLRQA